MHESLLNRLSSFLLILLSASLIGSCDNDITTDSSSVASSSSVLDSSYSDQIDGESDLVNCLYEFEDFDEFIDFYTIFKQYNGERFIFPASSSNPKIDYKFYCVGYREDVENKKYDQDFMSPDVLLYFTIADDLDFKMSLDNVRYYSFSDYYFSVEKSFYGGAHNSSCLNLYCDGIRIGQLICGNDYADDLTEILTNCFPLFKEGALTYAF